MGADTCVVSAQSRVFDPGIDPVEDDKTELLLEAVGDVVRSRGSRPLSFREGEFKTAGTPTKIINVLFDTGALYTSHISVLTWWSGIAKNGKIASPHIGR